MLSLFKNKSTLTVPAHPVRYQYAETYFLVYQQILILTPAVHLVVLLKKPAVAIHSSLEYRHHRRLDPPK